MGLLAQMIGGAMEGGGNTAANLMTKDYEARIQTERDEAQALRNQNLENLRARNTATAATTLFNRIGSGRAAEQMNSLSTSLVNGAPTTNQGVADTVASNTKAAGLIASLSAKGDARDHANNNDDTATGPPVPDNIPGNRPGNIAPEDQAAIDDAKAHGGTVTNPSLDLKQAQIDSVEERWKLRADAQKEIAAAHNETLKALLEAKLASGTAQDSSEIKKIMAGIAKSDQERKSLDSYTKILQNGDLNDPATVAALNKAAENAGMPDAVKPIPAAKAVKPAAKKGGLLSSIGSVFGGGDADTATPETTATATPAQALPNGMTTADVDAQAQAATMKVYADKTLTQVQKTQKVAAIRARRNQFVGVQ